MFLLCGRFLQKQKKHAEHGHASFVQSFCGLTPVKLVAGESNTTVSSSDPPFWMNTLYSCMDSTRVQYSTVHILRKGGCFSGDLAAAFLRCRSELVVQSPQTREPVSSPFGLRLAMPVAAVASFRPSVPTPESRGPVLFMASSPTRVDAARLC